MQGFPSPVLHEDHDSDSGSTSTRDCAVDQPPPKDITVEINCDDGQESQPPNALETLFSPRSYQLEMLEESLRQNIIVAMDTGSGKTHIAVLRIIEELKSSPADKLVWFLAPSVELCIQQYSLLQAEIPIVQTKLLQGNDGVEKWTELPLWDAILKNVRIVVSPHQVLLDALANGFIRIGRLSLLIFDEAHNCVKNHAGVKIMRDFYQHNKKMGLPIPHILGLSASPIMKSKDQSPEKIEETLNAICRTPKLHRVDMQKHVNMPEFHQILYNETVSDKSPQALKILHKVYREYDINRDPFILRLREENTPRNQMKLDKCVMSNKTWCHEQIKALYNTSQVILQELGSFAVNYYIGEVINRLRYSTTVGDFYIEAKQTREERCHLCNLLASIDTTQVSWRTIDGRPIVSDKVDKLISALLDNDTLVGIVFVKQRATVAVLGHLLSIHPATHSSLRIGTVVGSAQNSQRHAAITDLFSAPFPSAALAPSVPDQASTLNKFRRGALDLVIATTVLEEGIDVPACNLVMCFDEPSNLKSFVQRRGRARTKESKLVLMQTMGSSKLQQWQELELEMKRIYADDMRQLSEVAEIEEHEPHDGRAYRVESTGALLNMDNAVSHLYHFCSLLPSDQHVNRLPDFIYGDNAPTKVVLPLCCNAAVRVAWSRKVWLSERNARKDAAFEACMLLYKAGLINDNLMPLMKTDPSELDLDGVIEKRPSMVKVNALMNPWIDIAKAWLRMSDTEPLMKARVTVYNNHQETLSSAEMILPVNIPLIPKFRLYWDATTILWVEIISANPNQPCKDDELKQAQRATRAILDTSFGWRFPVEKSNFCVLFMPTAKTWEVANSICTTKPWTWKQGPGMGLIRDKEDNGPPYIFDEYLANKPHVTMIKNVYKEYDEVAEDVAHLAVRRITRRADFLHKVSGSSQHSSKRFSCILPAARCTVDETPFRVAQFALLVPSILRRMEIFMIGHQLSSTLLADVKFNDLSLVVAALSASSAHEETNYQSLEFIGDSILKMCTSMQLLAEYPLWHEGYLTAKRGQVISNSRLSRAALQTGLEKFIITKSFTGRKWRPPYVQDLAAIDIGDANRDISTKVLADVVEALLGAARIDGGVLKALTCMRIFLPEINWQPLEERRAILFARALTDHNLPPPLNPLEELLGYTFDKKILLVEAMTHASCQTGVASLERLEFLGDAVLDNIIVDIISRQEVELSHIEMHHLRTAFVNADFLAFMCMEWAIEQEVGGIVEDETNHSFHTTTSNVSMALWKFMLHSSREISNIQLETSKRHQALRDGINEVLANGSYYPWALLSRLSARKFYSDIVESLLGAVYIDSGSFDACECITERIGILPYLRRVLQDRVNILHPKEELGILADVERVRYEVKVEKRIVESVEVKAFLCEVFVGERSVAFVDDGVNKEEAKTKAAEAAVMVLKQKKAAVEGNKLC